MTGRPPLAGQERDLALVTRTPGLSEVLGALLEVWHYRVVALPKTATLILHEAGCPLPPPGKPVIHLGAAAAAGHDSLALPLAIGELWAALEQRFHTPPRAHIRIDQDRPAVVTARGREEATRIVSLSDLGTRFFLTRELVKGEMLQLRLALGGKNRRLPGRVIYVIPRGDHDDTGGYDIGMLFLHAEPQSREELHEFIVGSYLQRAAGAVRPELLAAGLDGLRLTPGLRKAVLGT